ncbi:MAG: hypothetical protein ACI4IF_01380 [Acutalibacteraceae bacterium]
MRKCESCGKAYSESKDIFCPHCGAVAHKKCAHPFSDQGDNNYYDESRFNRADDYSFNKSDIEKQYTQEKRQEQKAYGEKNDSGNYNNKKSDSRPEKTIASKRPVRQNKKSFKGIGIFIAVIVLFNVAVGVFEELDEENFFDDVFSSEQNVYCEDLLYVDADGIEFIKPDDNQYKMIISIDKLCIDYGDSEKIKEFTDYLVNEEVGCSITAYEKEKIEFDGIEDYAYESDDEDYQEEELYFGELVLYGDLGYVFAFEEFPELSKDAMTHIYAMTIGDIDEEEHESYDDYEMYYGSQYCVEVCLPLDAVSLDKDGNVKYHSYYDDEEIDGNEYQQYTEDDDVAFEGSDYFAEIDMKSLDITFDDTYSEVTVVGEEDDFYDYDDSDIAIIGGADGPTKIIVG